MCVSILIPAYNAARTLPRCLESLVHQTFRDFEVIVVDDGSTDATQTVLAEWTTRLPLRVLTRPQGGSSAARNAALAEATGEFVFMLDADDFVHPRLLELTVAAAREAGSDFVLFDFSEVAEERCAQVAARYAADREVVRAESLDDDPLRWLGDKGVLLTVWRFLFRRDAIAGESFVEGIMHEDDVFVNCFMARRPHGVYLRKGLYAYVQLATSLTHAAPTAWRFHCIDVMLRQLHARLDEETWRWLFSARYLIYFKSVWRSRPEFALAGELTDGWLRDGVVRRCDIPFRWRVKIRLFRMLGWLCGQRGAGR